MSSGFVTTSSTVSFCFTVYNGSNYFISSSISNSLFLMYSIIDHTCYMTATCSILPLFWLISDSPKMLGQATRLVVTFNSLFISLMIFLQHIYVISFHFVGCQSCLYVTEREDRQGRSLLVGHPGGADRFCFSGFARWRLAHTQDARTRMR